MSLVLGMGRDIFQAVAIAVLTAACNKLIDHGFDELKKRRKKDGAEDGNIAEGGTHETPIQ